MAKDVGPAPNRTERAQASSIKHIEHPKVAVQSLAAFDVQHRCVCTCGFRRSDIGDRPGDADAPAGALSNSEQQRRHLEGCPLCMRQLKRWRHRNVVGSSFNRLIGLRLVFGRSEDGIKTANHPAFAGARQIELTLAVSFEKCRHTVIALPPSRSSTSLWPSKECMKAPLDKPTLVCR